MQAADERQKDRTRGQTQPLRRARRPTTTATAARPTQALPDVPEWPDSEKLKYEKEALDFYISSHPLAQHEAELRALRHAHASSSCAKLRAEPGSARSAAC